MFRIKSAVEISTIKLTEISENNIKLLFINVSNMVKDNDKLKCSFEWYKPNHNYLFIVAKANLIFIRYFKIKSSQ